MLKMSLEIPKEYSKINPKIMKKMFQVAERHLESLELYDDFKAEDWPQLNLAKEYVQLILRDIARSI